MIKKSPRDFDIQSIEELREWFHMSDEPVFVKTSIRKNWMIGHNKLIKGGKVLDIDFVNLGGGVWRVELKK